MGALFEQRRNVASSCSPESRGSRHRPRGPCSSSWTSAGFCGGRERPGSGAGIALASPRGARAGQRVREPGRLRLSFSLGEPSSGRGSVAFPRASGSAGRASPRSHARKRMPTYQYQCRNCGTSWRSSSPSPSRPARTAPVQHREPRPGPGGGAGLIFKGSGSISPTTRRLPRRRRQERNPTQPPSPRRREARLPRNRRRQSPSRGKKKGPEELRTLT